MTGNLDMGRNSIKNLRDPSLGSDAATKGYVERTYVKYEGATADINMQSHNRIINLVDPRDPTDAVNKAYVDNLQSKLLGSHTVGFTVGRGGVDALIRVRLSSVPGNTIKVVIEVTHGDRIKINKATQLVSAREPNLDELSTYDIIPIIDDTDRIASMRVFGFLPTDLEIGIDSGDFLRAHPQSSIKVIHISIKIYKSYA